MLRAITGAATHEEFTRRNVGEAEASGLEIEGVAALTNSLRLNFAVAWLDTEYTDLGPPRVPPPDSVASCCNPKL